MIMLSPSFIYGRLTWHIAVRESAFSLALFESLVDGFAASVENHLDALAGIIVGGDNEVYVLRVGIGINDSEY